MSELTIAKSLSKAYRQVSIGKQSFDTFKQQLGMLYEQIATIDTEEKLKGDLMDFLKLTFYGQNYKVSPNGRIISAVFCRSASSMQFARISSRFSDVMMNASLHPVNTPLNISTSHSFSGTPADSTLAFILCSISLNIAQTSLLNDDS